VGVALVHRPSAAYNAIMQRTIPRPLDRTLVPVAAGLLVLALAAAVWTITLRERSNRRLYLEYEVYKALTALTDLVRAQSVSSDDIKNVRGFGLYGPDGVAITVYGNAPASIEPPIPSMSPSRFSLGEDSVTMIRILGGDLPGRRMMMNGLDRGSRTRGQPAAPPAGNNSLPPGAERMPTIAYIEYAIGGFKAEQAVLLGVAGIATLALGLLYGVIAMMNERYITARQREAKDRELLELGQAARTIAHEIKNPLGVIRIQCGLLKRGADAATIAGLSVIDHEAVRLAELAERIRTYLKSDDTPKDTVAVRPFLESFMARYAGLIDASLDVDTDVFITINKAGLTEALDNIVANALEASTAGEERPVIEARVKQQQVRITIMDRGPGIAEDHAQRIFEPFFTTKSRGSGLGLALAKKNIEASGGSVRHERRAGGGASFVVSVPLASAG